MAGAEYRDLYRQRSLQEQLYFGSISAMDEQVGRLRDALRQWGAAENTMLWFTSDNGPENRTPGSPGPFRDRKRDWHCRRRARPRVNYDPILNLSLFSLEC